MYYPCLDNLHATESNADGAVVTSSIVARLKITTLEGTYLLAIGTS